MKPPFQKDRKLDLSTLEDWPRKIREDKAAAIIEKQIDKCPCRSSKSAVKRGTTPGGTAEPGYAAGSGGGDGSGADGKTW